MKRLFARPLAALSALAALTFVSSVSAVTLNPRGIGQALIYPYYTVNKNQDTLVTIGNVSDVGKSVDVKFKEGMNGRWLLDLRLFLAPYDVWTARISADQGDEGATLFTSDHSCTYPPLPTGGQPFSASEYAGGSSFPPDGGPSGVSRTREGFLTVVARGDIVPGSALDLAIHPVQNGTPSLGVPLCTPSVINSGAEGDIVAPGDGLVGSAAIVNVGEGTFFSYRAEALADFTAAVLGNGASVTDPLSQANSESGYAVASLFGPKGQPLSVTYDESIDAVSAVLMGDAIDNDYLVSAGLGANTDWIVNFPTKPFYTDNFYNPPPALFRAPFVEGFGQTVAGQSRVLTSCTTYDQEALALGGSGSCTLTLPYTVNVISFLDTDAAHPVSGVFGSALATNLRPSAAAGWMQLGLDPSSERHVLTAGSTPAGPVALNGLPVVGFMVYNIINANAQPGQLANYGGVFPHRSTVSCSSTSGSAVDPC